MDNIFINFEFSKLEFDKILNEIKEFCACEKTRDNILDIKIEYDYNKVVYSHHLLKIIIDYFVRKENFSISVIYNFSDELNDISKDRILDEISLYKLAYSVNLYFNIRRRFLLDEYKELLYFFNVENLKTEIYKEILKYIDENGNVLDEASKELATIRKKISNIQEKIKNTIQLFLKRYKLAGYLTDDIIVERNNFNCLAVKANYKNKVNGIVIDSSNSGQTFYIVPDEVFSLYNEISVLFEEEKNEIYKICKHYTEKLKIDIDELKIINKNLLEFDLFYAKAKFSFARGYNSPEIVEKKIIKIIDGKHPLLGEKAVPLNFKIGDKYKILIISGPNTGGKSVVLKTVGLFVLMVQAGIAIPASSSSQFTVFKKIFLDIGDEQSIEQSLSTFSAHISKIKLILENADKDSLVLIDELCNGTDPIEGASLAISILERIRMLSPLTVITTHYFALKVFASENEEIENASMEFDNEKLTPTYKLQIGIPGSSRALEISKRLGLNEEIIDDAIKNLNTEYINVQKLINHLESVKLEQEKEKIRLKEIEERLKELERYLNEKEEELKEKEKRINELIKFKESAFLREARKEFENIIKKIKDENASKESIQEGKSFLEKVKEHIENETSSEVKLEETKYTDFKKGDEVIILSKNIKGIILGKTNVKNEFIVQAGMLKMTFDAKELKKIEEDKEERKVDFSYSAEKKAFSFVLDLRGIRFEDAQEKIEKFIEDAIVNKVKQIKVIHGIGTGAIRKCLHDFCKKDSRILSFEYEKNINSNSTNFGVTVIYLK